MNQFVNITTGQAVEWDGSIEQFNAASDPSQVGQWTPAGAEQPAVPATPAIKLPEPKPEPVTEPAPEAIDTTTPGDKS